MASAGSAAGASRSGFEAAVEPLLLPAYRLACAMLMDPAEAEDAVQEASLKAWRSWQQLRDPAAARNWFLSIVANQCRTLRRRRPLLTLSYALHLLVPAEDLDERIDLTAAMSRLPRVDRGLLVMRYYLDLSVEDAAAASGLSVGAAKSRLHRAVRRLRPLLNVPEARI